MNPLSKLLLTLCTEKNGKLVLSMHQIECILMLYKYPITMLEDSIIFLEIRILTPNSLLMPEQVFRLNTVH